jgi:hypothetical protein
MMADNTYADMGMSDLINAHNALAVRAGAKERKQFPNKTVAIAECVRLQEQLAKDGGEEDPRPRFLKEKTKPVEANGKRPAFLGNPDVPQGGTVASAEPETKAKAKKPKASGGDGPFREGTDRAKVAALCDGTKTITEIAESVGKDKKWLTTVLHCMKRDKGVTTTLDKQGRVKMALPR